MTAARNGAPANPHWESRIRHEISVQGVTPLFEVVVDECAPGRLTLSMPLKAAALQQYKVVHGGLVAMLADAYCLEGGMETHTARLVNTLIVARGIAARVYPKE